MSTICGERRGSAVKDLALFKCIQLHFNKYLAFNAHLSFPVQELRIYLGMLLCLQSTVLLLSCINIIWEPFKPTEEVYNTDATARLCFDMASMAARCQHELFSYYGCCRNISRVCTCMSVYIDWCGVWQDTHSKDQTGSHQLDFFSLSYKPQS